MILPLKIFSVSELGIDHANYLQKLKKYYSHYEYDEYLYRQNIINRCIDNGYLNYPKDKKEIESFYLLGHDYIFDNPLIDMTNFNDIKKYRKRMICRLRINKNGIISR